MSRQGWPEKRKVGQYPIDYDYRAEGFNEALSLCLAAHVKEKAELIGKIPSMEEIVKELKNIGEYWTICKQDAGRELLVLPMGQEAIKIKAQAIHSELMRRLK